jgi:hypothetical protein
MSQSSRSRIRLAFGAAMVASMGFGVTQAVAKPQAEDAGPRTCPTGTIACTCGVQVVACVSPGQPCPHCP